LCELRARAGVAVGRARLRAGAQGGVAQAEQHGRQQRAGRRGAVGAVKAVLARLAAAAGHQRGRPGHQLAQHRRRRGLVA